MSRRKDPSLVLAADFGGSSTKAFYALPSGEIASVVLRPEVVEVPSSAISAYEAGKLGAGLPENEVWVSFNGEFYAVGYLAASQLAGNPRLSELKSRLATVKVLALLWVIVAREPQLGKKLKVALGALLPGGELADRSLLERDLNSALGEFDTPGGTFKVELLKFDCLPEGAGIYAAYRQQAGERIFQQRLCFFMLGYRNVSVLLSDRGSVKSAARTSDLGMVQMLERVQQRTSGLEPERLLAAIVRAGDEIEREALWSVGRARNVEERAGEIDRLGDAVRDARREYVAMLKNWLSEVLPDTVERIVFSGGTADYLRRELEEIFPFTPLEFHGGIEVPEPYDPHGYGSRLADVWGTFVRLLAWTRELGGFGSGGLKRSGGEQWPTFI
ncbi:MAG: ParM/StbA family protein [Cyanobacteriota bacterium]|nr:ParM/StbA family protein [Cyanobacteriota bacterium]